MIITNLEEAKNLKEDTKEISLMYRGQVNCEWDLTPKLFREKNSITQSIKYEISCFRPYLNGKTIYHKYYNSPLEHLINLQHYVAPTRLLDFTNDFFVALFFACYDPSKSSINKNSKIFVLHKDFFETYHNSAFNFYYIDEVKKEMKRLLDTDCFYIIDPKLKNPRMKRQNGLFLLFPLRKLENYENDKPVKFDDFVREENLSARKQGENRPFWYAHMEVNANSKEKILNELNEEFQINAETVFESQLTNDKIRNNYSEIMEDINQFYENNFS